MTDDWVTPEDDWTTPEDDWVTPPRELPTLHGAENYQPPTPAPPAPPPEPLANLGDNPDGTVNPTPGNPAMGGFGTQVLRALGTPETPPPQNPGFVDPATGIDLGGTVNQPTPENPANAGIENIGRQGHEALQSLRLPGEPTAEQHRAADAAAGNLIPPPGGMGPDRSIERLQRAADQNSRSLADQIAPENRAAIAEAQGGNIPPVERPQWSPEEMRARGIALPPASAIDWAYQLANLVGRGAAYTPISALRTPETFLDMIHEQQRRLMEMGRHVLTLDDAQANSVLRWARQTLGDRAGNFTRDFVALRRGEISPAEFQQTLGDLLETSNWWRAARLASQSFVDRNLPVSPEAAQSILGQIAQGMGSSIGGVLLHMLPGGVWLAGAAFTGAGVDEAVQRAISSGASNEQIIRSMLGGGISGGTDLVELEILMRPFAINRGAYAFMLGTARRMVEQGVTEGIQEGAQELIQNLNEGRIYNPQRRAWENVAESAALGAAVGAIMGGITAPFGRGGATGDVAREPRPGVEPPAAATPPTPTEALPAEMVIGTPEPGNVPQESRGSPAPVPRDTTETDAGQPPIALPEPAPTFGARPVETAQQAEQPAPPAAVTPTGAVAEPETQQAPIPPAPVTALPIEEQTAQAEALPAAQQVAAQAAAVPTVAQAMPSARVAEPAAQAVPFPLDAPAPDPRTIPRPQLIALQQQYGPELVSVLFDNPNVGNPNFTLRAALQEAESARLARNPVSPAPAPAQVQPDAQRAPVEAPPAPPDSPPPGGPAATIRRWGGLSEAERADMRRIAPALRDAMLARTISPTPDAVAEHFGVTPNVAYVALRSLAGRSYSGVTFVRGDTPDNARFRYGPRQSTADRVGWERDKNRAAMERAARELDLEYGPNTSDADLERALIEAAAKHTENQAAAEAEVEAERRLILEAEQIMAEAAPETYNDVPFDIGPDEAQVQPVQSDASGADRPVGEQRPEPSEPAAKSARGADQGGAQGARTAAISPGSAERTKAGRAGPVSTDATGRSGTTEPAGNADAGRGERKPNRDTGARAGADTGHRVDGAPGPDVPFERPAPQPGETREIDGLTARRYEDGWSIARKAERGPNWIRESHRPGNTPAEALANYRSYEGAKRQESATAQANQAAFDAALAKVRAGTETDADLRALTRFGNYSISTQPAIGLLRELGLRAGDARRALNGLVSRISAGGAEIYDVRDVVARARRNSGGLFERPAVFYSALTRAAETAKIAKGTPDQWLATLRNTPGVKQDEIDWSGLDPWLRQQTGSVTREAVTDFLRANEVRVEEVTKGGKAPAGTAEAIDKWLTDSGNSESENRAVVRDAVNGDAGALAHLEGLGIPSELLNPIYAAVGDGATKFHSYALPGGENYRELLLTLPDPGRIPTFEEWYEKTHISPLSKYADDPHMMAIFRAKYESEAKNFPREGLFRRSHWDEPNVLAHVRFSDRTDADGKKVLLVDEVQSDWHQQGRAKGYAGDLERSLTAEERELRDLNAMSWDGKKWTPEMADRQHELTQRVGDSLMEKVRQFGGRNVPDAPFKTQWPELAMKRMLRWAAEHGYDRLAWTPGEVQAERYDLSKQISRIALFDLGGGRSTLRAYDHENRAVIERDIADPQRELPDLIGKDATEKLLAQEPLRPKLIEKLSATDISIEPGEHGWVISAPDGRRVEIGRGTVENEAAARDYGLRYLNQKAEGINAGRRAAAPGPRELRGLDLKVGGEGMRGFYDKMLPAAMNRYVKKWGARVGTTTIEKPGGIGEWRYEGPTLSPAEIRAAAKTSPHGTVTVERTLRDIADAVERGEAMPRAVEKFGSYAAAEALGGELIDMPTGIRVHSLDITPAMRASVMQGQPMWRREGSGTSEGEAQPINDTLRARSTPEWTNSSARQKAVRVLLRTLKRKAPQANLVVSENLEGRVDGEPDWFRVTGAYDPVADLVAVALNREATDTAPEFTLDHEILHHLKRSGLITDAEWSALERAAKDNGWITQELRDRYPGASESLLTEEAIADAYARWSQDRNPKGLTAAVVRMFRRIQEFFRGLRSDLRGAGITAEGVFRAIEGGKVGARKATTASRATAFAKPEQTVLPGAEAISDKELAERRMAERGTQKQKGKVAKDIEDTPLFDTGARKQGSLFERVPPLLPPAEPPSRSPLASAGHRIGQAARALASSVVQDVKMNLAPMAATKSEYAQAAAKDFANWDRLAHAKLNMIFEQWKKRFTPDRLNAMWQALNKASEDSLAGEPNPEAALNILNPEERAEVERLTEYGKALWTRAEAAGVVQKGAEGIPFYATRIAAKIGLDGKLKLIENTQGIHALDTIGRNLTTKGTDRRIYATADEAERAMKAMFGPDTVLVRNILALPIAFARMERAIAGKNLIQAIKEYGEQSGFDAVNTQGGAEFFTLDHPAFKQYRPRFNREDDGTITAVKDENGDQILDTTSIYVHRDFEGPLRAVLTANKPGAVYNGLMRWKAAATQMIMFSPTIHLAVEFARALPLKPGKMITLRLFRDGYKAKNDEAQMREAILSGLAPIANRGLVADITDTQAEPAISDATGKVISAAKKFSKFWHQTLLWDRIADLQYGIWKTVRDDMMAKGIDRQTASRTAAHLANRYAGALPREAMSGWATKVANVAMFSRSFTLGNLGVFKDMLNGMPEDFRAQIERDAGKLAAVSAQSFARRKAIGAFAIDILLFMAGNALLQMGFSALRGDDWDEIQRGYVRRFHSALRHIGEHPWESLFGLPGSIFHSVNQLLPQGDNEPGKQDRILVGYDSHGRGIYMRSPISKIGEEFLGWMTRAREMALAKESTMLRPIMETLTNDRGFGRQVYNPNDPTLLIIGNVVTNLVRSQLPMSMIEAGRDMLGREGSTRDRTVAALQTFGPFAGLMFSQGHPAGPIGAEIAAQSQEHQAAIRQAMPDINRRLRAAMEPQNEATRTQRLDAAIQEMTALGMSRGQIRRQMQIAGSPDAVVSRSRVVQAYRTANPEQRQRLDLLFGRTAE